ncbi:MAG: M67 family metallopeptidase [Anaerolineaceae bacterium]|nr:M67 family metallopeptidase [Anaerolineaceae bacterium]
MNDSVRQLIIPDKNWHEMVHHIQSCLPEESCGLAGGLFLNETARISLILPVVNQLHSPVRFRMDPAGQLNAMHTIEEHGLELVAIFHSHPNGPEIPSATDLHEFYYPGVLSLILSPLVVVQDWCIRAFHITSRQFCEVAMTRLIDYHWPSDSNPRNSYGVS